MLRCLKVYTKSLLVRDLLKAGTPSGVNGMVRPAIVPEHVRLVTSVTLPFPGS
jgi:hypothetical protein